MSMHKIFPVFVSLIFFGMKFLTLDAPLPREQEDQWRHVPGKIALFTSGRALDEALHFVVDDQDKESGVVLSLDAPKNKEEVSAFLQRCQGYIDHKGHQRFAMVVVGQSIVDQAQHWITENVIKTSSEPTNFSTMMFGSPALKVEEATGDHPPSLDVTYTFALPTMHTTRDLRKLWNLAFIQQMTSQRLKAQKVTYEEKKSGSFFLLPQKAVTYHLAFGQEQKEFSHFLRAIEEIKQVGFTVEEFDEAKILFLTKIDQIQKNSGAASLPKAAVFHAEGFLRNLELLSYGYFLESARTLIESITPVDIAIHLKECFTDEERHVLLTTPTALKEIAEGKVRKEMEETGLLRIQNSPEEVATDMEAPLSMNGSFFERLPIADHDRGIIYKIFDTMARDNVLKLGLKKRSMERKGKRINHVHPLALLGYVFSDPYLHNCMREISQSGFKWNGFVDGYKDRFKEELSKDNIFPHLPAFAELVGRDEGMLRMYINRRDWDGLARYLL